MLFYHEKIIAYVRLRSGRARRLRRTREDRVRQTAEIVAGVHPENFPREVVKDTEMDREASWDKYTVYFNSGNQVSFEGGSGDCSQIIMKNGSVPMSVIPAKIKTYAGNNYAGQRIVMMETTADGYKVALADKTVLDFDKDGNFTKATK